MTTNKILVDDIKRKLLRRLNTHGDCTYGEMLLVCGYFLRGERKLRRTDWYLSPEGYQAVRELVQEGRAKLIKGTCRTFLAPAEQLCPQSKVLRLSKT